MKRRQMGDSQGPDTISTLGNQPIEWIPLQLYIIYV